MSLLSRAAAARGRLVDPLIFGALLVSYLAWLVASAHELGYARDEGFYFHAARTYGKWFEILLAEPSRALQQGVVDQFWRENHEHPALMKSLFWASERLLGGRLFEEQGTAYRFPAMLLSALAVATTFAWGRRTIGRAGGIVAALSFALMPQIFYHSHLACFDMPIAALWLLTAYAYWRSLERGAYGWAVACALLFGLALNTKHNAWILPPALTLHAVALQVPGFVGWARARRRARGSSAADGQAPRWRPHVPLALVLMAVLGPAILYGTWPWIWNDTLPRLVEYVTFHTQHVYYNMEFLGETYFRPPFPRAYAWLMTLATVPAVTLLGAGIGAIILMRQSVGESRELARPQLAGTGPARPSASLGVSWASLWLLGVLSSYAPWLSTSTPIFGGTKHWITAYPFLALFAGRGFVWLVELPWGRWAAAGLVHRLKPWVLGLAVSLGPFLMTMQSHPWGLTAYTPLVGGAPGAATLGLNRSFWGYTTGSVVDYLNASAAPGDRVFIHDTAMDSFRMLQKDGRLSSKIKPWWTVSGSKLALYHHEQHMSRVEHMIWVDYGTTSPTHVATFDGVPMVWVYRRGGPGQPVAAASSPGLTHDRSADPGD